MSDRGRSGALLGKASPGTGHTIIAGSWVDKAMCIWDGEDIGVSILPPMSQAKHVMLRETAVQWPCPGQMVTCVMPMQMQVQRGQWGQPGCEAIPLHLRHWLGYMSRGYGAGLLDLPRPGERRLLLV